MFFNSEKRKEKKRLKAAQKQLEEAILSDDNEQINAALKSGADPNKPNDNNVLPLSVLFARENMAGAEVLLQNGALLSAEDSYGTPIHTLSQFSDQEAALDLLEVTEEDYDLEVCNAMDQTPLHMACISENSYVAKVFVEIGANVNARDNAQSAPIFTAAYNGDFDLVLYFFEHGADLNVKNSNDESPLMSAINSPAADPDLIVWILNQGADVDEVNTNDETPLHLACKKGTEEYGSADNKELIIFYLLANGADPNPERDRNRKRPIDYVKDDSFILAQLLGNADDIYDDPVRMLTEIGTAALMMKMPQTAEPFLIHAVQYDEDNGTANYYLGVLLLEAGEEERSMDFLVKAAQLGDPEALDFMKEMGIEFDG